MQGIAEVVVAVVVEDGLDEGRAAEVRGDAFGVEHIFPAVDGMLAALADIGDGERIVPGGFFQSERDDIGVIVLMERSQAELAYPRELPAGKTVNACRALILAAEHILPVNIHSLIGKSFFAVTLSLQGPQEIDLRLCRGDRGETYQRNQKKYVTHNNPVLAPKDTTFPLSRQNPLSKKRRHEPNRVAFMYPRSESNRDQRNRNPLFYPLNYRGIP